MYEYSSTFAWLAEVHAANNTEGFDIVELVELFEIEPRISKIDWQPPAMTHHLSIRLTSDSPNIVGTSTLIGILIGIPIGIPRKAHNFWLELLTWKVLRRC